LYHFLTAYIRTRPEINISDIDFAIRWVVLPASGVQAVGKSVFFSFPDSRHFF
jgi:hypothetical protein